MDTKKRGMSRPCLMAVRVRSTYALSPDSANTRLAKEEAEQLAATTLAIHDRLGRRGKLVTSGNRESDTDANDWAIDCVLPPPAIAVFRQYRSPSSPPTSRRLPTI